MSIDWKLGLVDSGKAAMDSMAAFEAGRNRSIQEQELKRADAARTAEANYFVARHTPGMSSVSVDRATEGGSPMGGQAQFGPATSSANLSLIDLARADPRRAFQLVDNERKAAKDQLDLEHQLNNAAINMLARARDQQSYDQMKTRAARLYGQYGIDVADFGLPDAFDPDAVHGLLLSALDTDKRLAAERGVQRLAWDIEDDQIDNDRADRNADSLIEDRTERRGLVARGQNLADARGRRGQDIASSDRRRGQNMADVRTRRGQDMTDKRARDGVGGSRSRSGRRTPQIVQVRTPEEARNLTPGTMFRTPDGRVKVR